MINIKNQIAYWKKTAEISFNAADVLFKNKHYDSALFFCHLAIEKLLKGLVVQETKNFAPYIHDLEKLASYAKITLTNKERRRIRTITTFNIAGRYENQKYSFYKKCTKKFAAQWLQVTKELFLCLKKQYLKK